MNSTNPYCEVLGIEVPRLDVAMNSPDANYYALLIATLLERGEPMTLIQVAKRFAEVGIAPVDRALASLKRCKPARAPVYRDGDLYALDPHDHETDLWAFRLGLRPPKAIPSLQVVRPAPAPLPTSDHPLTLEHLDEAWRSGIPNHWSAQRIAVCVLDAHGKAMPPEDVRRFVEARSRWCPISSDSAKYWRRGAAIHVRDDGSWALDIEHDAARSARQAVAERIATVRRWTDLQPDPSVIEAYRRRSEREHQTNAESLAHMSRVIIHAFPTRQPEAIVLLDVGQRSIETLVGEELTTVPSRLVAYDIIAALDVRALLRRFDFDHDARRLAELGPPQKSIQLNRQGRTLKITTSLLVQGSCGIGRPFGDQKVMRRYLEGGELTKLKRRIEADTKSLFALYQYGRLHGTVRLRWGFLDEMVPAPWVHSDETRLYHLKKRAFELQRPLEVVVGSAPGWKTPWSRAQSAFVVMGENPWHLWLVDERGESIFEDEIQLARLADR